MNQLIVVIFVLAVTVAMFAVSFKAVFIAFIKKKDERSKWIVTKSMANSFVVVTTLQCILFAIKMINFDFYTRWWNNFKEGIYIEPVLLSFIVLGVFIMTNSKRHGGSL